MQHKPGLVIMPDYNSEGEQFINKQDSSFWYGNLVIEFTVISQIITKNKKFLMGSYKIWTSMCRKLLIKSQVISSYNIGILILQMIRVHKGSDPTLKNYCISPISHYLVLKVQKVRVYWVQGQLTSLIGWKPMVQVSRLVTGLLNGNYENKTYKRIILYTVFLLNYSEIHCTYPFHIQTYRKSSYVKAPYN